MKNAQPFSIILPHCRWTIWIISFRNCFDISSLNWIIPDARLPCIPNRYSHQTLIENQSREFMQNTFVLIALCAILNCWKISFEDVCFVDVFNFFNRHQLNRSQNWLCPQHFPAPLAINDKIKLIKRSREHKHLITATSKCCSKGIF